MTTPEKEKQDNDDSERKEQFARGERWKRAIPKMSKLKSIIM